jgi:hypothetical protein
MSIPVPSDPRAHYTELARRPIGPGKVEITTRRTGPVGSSYSIREYDCRAMTFRYVGTGDSLAEAQRRAEPASAMTPLFRGSISWHIGVHACQGIR